MLQARSYLSCFSPQFLAAMELEAAREKALSYQSVLRYLEPRAEMRLLWRSALDIGTGYIQTLSNTIR